MSFENYTDCLFRAFKEHLKPNEVTKRKQEILYGVAEFHNFSPESVLYLGFNPAILVDKTKDIFVTNITKEARDFLLANKINFHFIPSNELFKYQKFFDVVIAFDEYFTCAGSDSDQKTRVAEICNLTKEYLITTCKDYKNQEFKDREFSIPAVIRGSKNNSVYLEFHDHDQVDRNSWHTEVYEIANKQLVTFGPFTRRAMFFKQLAKFSSDSGAVGFSIHKNLMYKSLIKKNYEHVISIRFENGS